MRRFYALFSSLFSGILVASVLMFGLGFASLDANDVTADYDVHLSDVHLSNEADVPVLGIKGLVEKESIESDCNLGEGLINNNKFSIKHSSDINSLQNVCYECVTTGSCTQRMWGSLGCSMEGSECAPLGGPCQVNPDGPYEN